MKMDQRTLQGVIARVDIPVEEQGESYRGGRGEFCSASNHGDDSVVRVQTIQDRTQLSRLRTG